MLFIRKRANRETTNRITKKKAACKTDKKQNRKKEQEKKEKKNRGKKKKKGNMSRNHIALDLLASEEKTIRITSSNIVHKMLISITKCSI